MEQVKTINGLRVYASGTWYEISDPREQRFLHSGHCEDGMTPRQVYESHYPPSERNGAFHTLETLFFISGGAPGFVGPLHIQYATLRPGDYSQSQEGYVLKVLRRSKRKLETFSWHERPLIIAARGFLQLPRDVLYQTGETPDATLHKSRFRSQDGAQLDAVTAWLDQNGHPWTYM